MSWWTAFAVLYMSGYPLDAVVRPRLPAEETSFLRKPFAATLVALKVREVLDRGKAGSGR